jgi:aminopeptidase N
MLRRPSTTVLGALAVLLACRASGTSDRFAPPPLVAHAPRARAFDVLETRLAVELLPETRSIRASAGVRLTPLQGRLEEVRLDFLGLEVEGVADGRGRALAFRHERGTLAIELAEPLAPGRETELTVRYSGRPERGLWFAGERADGSGPTLAFSHGQSQDSRGWFPCFDDPGERAATDLTISMPAGWIGVGPGARIELREEAGRRIERWREEFPHPAYLVTLVAGELQQVEGRAGEVPLVFLVEPQYADWIERTFAETDEVLAFLADYAGLAYPYPKYSQAAVDNFPWGGMENLSATTLTPLLLSDELGHADQPPFYLVAHEAAHQWFGDLFTCADWSHLWLNEGFATYMTLLYLERSRGVDAFRAELRETQEAYLAADEGPARRATVSDVWREPDDVFDTRTYQGAAARLHLLRFVVGDGAFQGGVRLYARENVGRGVVTDDFRLAMERAAGRSLERFFQQWFLSPGFPEFAVAWDWDADERALRLVVEQAQESRDGTPAVFELPVEVEVRTAAGARTFRLELDERRERFELELAEAPLYVRFDAHGWIPKRVREEKEVREWLALAELAEDVNARREAVLALGRLAGAARARRRESPECLEQLTTRLGHDGSPWVRADAATALAQGFGDGGGEGDSAAETGVEEAEDALRAAALADPAPRVRSAALRALCAFGPDAGLASLAEELFHEAPSYGSRAAAAALLASAAPERAFEFLAAALELGSPHDALAALLLPELAALPDTRVPAELRRHAADPMLAPTARAAAVRALAGSPRERVVNSRFLVPFLAEESFHLRGAAVDALASFGDEGARRALAAYYPRARTSPERRTIEALLARREL